MDRGEYWRTWRTTTYLTNQAGNATVDKVSEYTELSNGVAYRDPVTGQWLDSQDVVELVPGGGAAGVHAPMKAYFAPNLNTTGAITLTTARGQVFKSHPVGLYYRDLASGRVALIAPVRDTVGVLVPPNMVVYSNALAGVAASFVYVYAHNGFDQSLVLSEAPPAPDLLGGFNPATTRLEVWTALDQWPEPLEERPVALKRGSIAQLDLVDRLLIFEEGFLPVGAAYRFGDAEMPAPGQPAEVRVANPSDTNKVMVAKSRVRVGPQSVLVEAVNFTDLLPQLSALPAAGRRAQGAKPAAPNGSERKYAEARVPETPLKAAFAVASAGSLPRGVLVDWSYMPSPVNNTVTLAAGNTYYIPSSFYWGGTTVFNSGCVVKFKQNAYCLMYGPVSFPSSGAQCVFTSKDDDEKGDQITGADASSGCPSQAAAQAIWLYYETQPTTVNHALIRWAQRGVEEDENPGVYNYPSINSTAFENCGVGVYLGYPDDTLYLNGDTVCNVTTPLAWSGRSPPSYVGSLSTSCSTVAASFNVPSTPVQIQTPVKFLDKSTGSTKAFSWNFGDGSPISTTTAWHTYSTPGIYTVALTVTGGGGDRGSASRSLLVYPTIVNVSRLTGGQYETSIAVNPANPNTIAVVANSPWPSNAGFFRGVSTDGGATFPTAGLIATTDQSVIPHGNSDPTVAFDFLGNLYVAYIGYVNGDTVNLIRSMDGGQTFTLVRSFADYPYPLADRPALAVGPGAGGANGSVWVAYDVRGDPTSAFWVRVAGASISSNGTVGTEWSGTTVNLTGSRYHQYPSLAVGHDGRVIVSAFYYGDPNYSLWYANDTWYNPNGVNTPTWNSGCNGGNGNRVKLTTLCFKNPPCSPDRLMFANACGAVDRSGGLHNGRTYLVWADALSSGDLANTAIYLAYTDSPGVNGSWTTRPAPLNDDTSGKTHCFPAIAVDQTSGNVAVCWYDCRNDPNNVQTQCYGAISTDGGVTFSANIPIAPGPSNARATNPHDGNDYGDYTGLSYHAGVVRYTWADNSNSTGDNPNFPISQNEMNVYMCTFHY